MTIENFDVTATLEKVNAQLEKDQDMSETTRSLIEVLLLIVTLLVNRLGLNSRNSSKSPATDLNRKKTPRKESGKSKGAQKGHKGTTLMKVDAPDVIEELCIDQKTLPTGNYRQVGYESRQVFDIQISRTVTEYRAEILEDETGKRFVAEFPTGVTQAVQYGTGVKAHAVYMSQFQLLPYGRITDYFSDQMDFPISAGTLFNFNQSAYESLEAFEALAKQKLIEASVAHADETGMNVDGKRRWLHCFSTERWTMLFPHEKRGSDAIEALGILPDFNGTLCHDHWKPYYKYDCQHALCNAHHIRELTCAFEQYGQQWAKQMMELLQEINLKTIEAGGELCAQQQEAYRLKYRTLIRTAEKECPPPKDKRKKGQRGKIKKSKPRNLLERLRDYESDVLRFMSSADVPFTNNQGERDLRMTKVQQKISGCFRSFDGAKIFCRVRSYLSTCKKHDISATTALSLLFEGKLPDFDSGLNQSAE
jgi:transposase